LLASTVTTLSTCVTPPAKSARLMTCTLFSLTLSAVRLFGALSCTRSRYGPVVELDTLKVLA
jgi:hypothetical protein